MIKMKSYKNFSWILSLVLLLFLSGIALADSSMVNIEATEVIKRDKFVGAQSLRNNGTIEGDLFFGAKDIRSTGPVTGDIIGAGSEIVINGPVLGNVRVVGSNINLDGKIGKNVNVFGGVINITKDSEIGGNLLVFGGQISIDGKVKGYTHIGGQNIVLKGEFFGDVDVNTDFDHHMDEDFDKDSDEVATLKVLPGTVIHGRLKCRGIELNIEKGADVADVDWVKPTVKSAEKQRRELTKEVWGLIRLLFGTAVYFLFGWAFYKLFPAVFHRQGEVIAAKPLTVTGVGLIGLVSTLASLVVFVVLLIFSVLINPGIGLIFGTAMTLGYILLFYFSTIPVALWLGSLMLKNATCIPYRFGVGLATLTVSLFILKLLAKLPIVGPVFPVLRFIAVFVVMIMGVGALLYAIKDLITAARKGEQKLIDG